ncbi:hypothetical protein HY087_00615 [Candidatus Gottesmanbacteria bacterium]|nr:hypothetical protein [Candidatus Gottesmanbacteria bacterium]MBI3559616.1 hypothetical protein [Candidatus Gottesmanbacteria bacterium]
MPEIVIRGVRIANKDIVTYRRVRKDGNVIELFDSRTRILAPGDNIKEPGERVDCIDPVLQVNPETGQISIT